MTWGVHVTLAARWLDPGETEGVITPFMVLYALHDALVKPMPGGLTTPSLAESWTMSKDGLTCEFVLRKGIRFHNGDPVTGEDVKFSFERYQGGAAEGESPRGAGRRPRASALPSQGAVARLHDVLRHVSLGRRVDRPQEVHRASR